MKSTFKRAGLILFAASLLFPQSGCMTPAQKLDESAVMTQLHEGQTQAEVRSLLGLPKRSETGSNGKKLDLFVVISRKVPVGMSSKIGFHTLEMRSVHVLYGTNGQVEKFTFHLGEAKGFGGQEWQAGRWLTLDQVDRIQRGITTRDGVLKIFGPATLEGLDVYGNKTASWLFVQGQQGTFMGGRELFVWFDANSVVKEYSLRDVRL